MGERTIENITVSVRIRPLNQRELTSGGEKIWEKVGELEIKEKAGARSFAYDRVYSEDTETAEIFEYQGVQVIEKCISGFNGCIFCYGQTGSGKTHTMHGVRKTNPGLVPLSIEHIFSMIQKSSGKEFLIRCAYIEIYNESINDLLNPNLLNLQLAEDKRSGIKIPGVTEEVCTSSHQVNSLLAMGEKHRITASTNFNQRSSRSHSM
jgi:centromeric protein E